MQLERRSFETVGHQLDLPMRIYALLLCLLVVVPPALGQVEELRAETVMRAVQARREAVSLNKQVWPTCCDGTRPAPDYPPDGFYESRFHDEDCGRAQVQSIVWAMWWTSGGSHALHTNFLKPEFKNLEGSSINLNDIDNFAYGDFTKPTVTTSNYKSVLNELKAIVDQLKYKRVSASQTDREAGPGNGFGDGDSCAAALDDAKSNWGRTAWTSASSSIFMAEGVWSLIEGEPDQCDPPNPLGPPDYGAYADSDQIKGRINVDLSALSGSGTVYAKARMPSGSGEISNADLCPVAVDEAWHSVASPGGGSNFYTSFYGTENPELTATCADYDCAGGGDPITSRGWQLYSQVCIFEFDFNEAEGEDKCDADEVLKKDEDEQNNEGEGGSGGGGGGGGGGGDGDCGGGGGPGGGAGAGKPENGPTGPGDVDGEISGNPREPLDPTYGFPIQYFPYPVALPSGHKLESSSDLTVNLTGKNFRLVRAYNSKPDLYGSTGFGYVGSNWTMGTFARLLIDASGGTPVLTLTGPPMIWNAVYRESSSGSGEWIPGGASAQVITKEILTLNTKEWAVWRLSEPGAWKIDFYRDPDVSETTVETPDASFIGKILQERDVYGTAHTYRYQVYAASSGTTSRLYKIFLNGTGDGNTPEAEIFFSWLTTDSSGTPYPPSIKGMLDYVQVIRFDSLENPFITQAVDYTYHTGTASDLGTAGDLIEVVKSTQVDSAPAGSPFWRTVTQYRYHDGTAAGSDPDERFNTRGDAHQLKMIILPEQVEHFAQQRNESGLVWNPEDALLSAAAEIRGLADDGVPTTWPTTPKPELIDFATKVVSYHGSGTDVDKVQYQYIQTACGCGGGATQGMKLEFKWYEYDGTGQDSGITAQMDTFRDTGSGYESTAYRTEYHDMRRLGGNAVPYIVQKATIEPSGRKWVTHYEYDDPADGSPRTLIRLMTPSATSSYTPVTPGSPPTAPSYTANTSDGKVYAYDYTTDYRVQDLRIGKGALSTFGAFTLVKKISYGDGTGDTRKWLAAKVERYRDETSSAANDVETAWFTYDFHSGDKIAWAKIEKESELEAENGQAGTGNKYTRYELYDSQGLHRWSRAADMALTKRGYASGTGVLSSITRNADPADLDTSLYASISKSGWGRLADGGTLTSTYTHDLLGRVTSRTSPGDVTSYTIREMRTETTERPDIYYLAYVKLPHKLGDDTFNAPARVTWFNADRDATRSSEYELSNPSTYDPTTLTYTLSTELARRTTQHLLSGLVETRRQWHDVNGTWFTTAADRYYETAYEYDALGRLEYATNDNGTVTHNKSFDVLDRVLEAQVGSSTSDLVTVANYYFDSGGTTTQGTGNGNLTLIRQSTGENGTLGAATRDTERTFDYRDRLITVENAEAPHEYIVYDNMNRIKERAVFNSVPTGIGAPLADRELYSTTAYSQRGAAYRQRVAIAATESDPGAGSGYLETHSWYDSVGRTIASWAPNGPASKQAYDGLSRVTTAYITDRGGDAAPGATGNYADADDVTGDTVLEQMSYTYDEDSTRWAGRALMSTSLYRNHDATATGALGSSSAVSTYAGYYYDDADRQIRTVNFGTNTTGFTSGGTSPTWPPSSTPEWNASPYNTDDYIVSAIDYNTRGLVDTAKSSEGDVSKNFYDDLSRHIASVENYVNATIDWEDTDAVWTISGLDDSELDTDRATSFVYDGSSNVTKQTAHLPTGGTSEKVQVTEYVYSTSVGSVGSETDSLVGSYDLLSEVRYPDESTGAPGSTDAYKVKYAYNRLGELRSVTDQNTTRHAYHRDDLGRVTADKVSAFGTGIDQGVKRINVAYDGAGRLLTGISYSDTSAATEVNGVKFAYNSLWQADKVFQDHDSAVTETSGTPTGNTEVVQYAYSETAVASGNHSRQTSMTYPDGSVMNYVYGTTADVNDKISRVTGMKATSFSATDNMVQYSYVGLGMTAEVDYPVPDVQLDRTFSHDGQRRTQGYTSQAAGAYPGWDRFGRTVIQPWMDGSLDEHATDPDLPNLPPILEETYSYDRDSNRLSRYDDRPGAHLSDRDFDYTYDGLDRLIKAERGVQGAPMTLGVGSQEWALDMLGSWTEVRTDLNGNGTYTDTDEKDTRTHNEANEIDDRLINTSPTTPALPLAYDDAGNVKAHGRGGTATDKYVHDAWNRLVLVKTDTTDIPPTSTTIGEYEYNALHWRIVKRADTTLPIDGLDQERVMYYASSWRMIEERIDEGGYDSDPATYDRLAQQFWGMRYIDDAVLRRIDTDNDGTWETTDENNFYITDVQFSVRAMIAATDASLQERVNYNAYGVGEHRWPADFDGDGDVDTTDQGMIVTGKNIGDTGYKADVDLNRDGTITTLDLIAFFNWTGKSALSPGHISDPNGPDSSVGYDGYLFNPETALYHVRFRNYDPTLGRWLEEDPDGQVDGANLYGFVRNNPPFFVDPFGLRGQPDETTPTVPGGPIRWTPSPVPRKAAPKTRLLGPVADITEAVWNQILLAHLETDYYNCLTSGGIPVMYPGGRRADGGAAGTSWQSASVVCYSDPCCAAEALGEDMDYFRDDKESYAQRLDPPPGQFWYGVWLHIQRMNSGRGGIPDTVKIGAGLYDYYASLYEEMTALCESQAAADAAADAGESSCDTETPPECDTESGNGAPPSSDQPTGGKQ